MWRKSGAVGSSLFGFQDGITIASYVPKQNETVIVLSTMHDENEVDDETEKPEIIMEYNRAKCGVDTVDQMCGNYTVTRRTQRWPHNVFMSLLNVAGINSYIIYCKHGAEMMSRKIFLKNLAMSLMKPHLKQRARIRCLPINIRAIINN